jgi:hypothetical protein
MDRAARNTMKAAAMTAAMTIAWALNDGMEHSGHGRTIRRHGPDGAGIGGPPGGGAPFGTAFCLWRRGRGMRNDGRMMTGRDRATPSGGIRIRLAGAAMLAGSAAGG